MASKIEWTGHTWNPIVGCSVVSPGCTNCYAMKMAARLERMGVRGYEGLTQPSKAGAVWTGKMQIVESALAIPLKRRAPTTYFVNSMSDLFHESVPDEWIDRVFAVAALCPQHTFQVLTKRSARMRTYLNDRATEGRVANAAFDLTPVGRDVSAVNLTWTPHERPTYHFDGRWPLPNVWLGVSAEDQQRADERVPDLLATPAAIRFVSAEPLLGPLHLAPYMHDSVCRAFDEGVCTCFEPREVHLDWVIAGGESGPGARPMHPSWARSIRDQCAAAGVAFFHKQNGAWAASLSNDGDWPIDAPGFIRLRPDGTRGSDGWPMQLVGKKTAGRLLDNRTHEAMPEDRDVR